VKFLRRISTRSDFALSSLRSERPTTILLCLPVGRIESHYRWLRIVQMECTALERMGTYLRDRPPILFMMEEFATIGHMEIMERAPPPTFRASESSCGRCCRT
jgi:type IV secretion system protein VirD4